MRNSHLNDPKIRAANRAKEIEIAAQLRSLFNGKRFLLTADVLSQIRESPIRVARARKMLGIQSVRVAGQWRWYTANENLPKKLLEKNQREHRRKLWTICTAQGCLAMGKRQRIEVPVGQKKPKVVCPYCKSAKGIQIVRCSEEHEKAMIECMSKHGYYAPYPNILRDATSQMHCNHTSVYATKRHLQIETIQDRLDRYFWVMDRVVIEWLSEQVSGKGGKKFNVETVMAEADKSKIDRRAVYRAQKLSPNIQIHKQGDEEYWYDTFNG